MTWTGPIEARHGAESFVLIPSAAARIQDLGPFRTGQLLETDILPGSALIASAEGYAAAMESGGPLRFTFEGNAGGAVNLHKFHERCACAAGRLSRAVPSIAYGEAMVNDLTAVARYDMQRFTFIDIIDDDLIEAWSGERMSSVLPPKIDLPCYDLAKLCGLFNLPMSPIVTRPGELVMWKFLDGNILIAPGSDPMVMRRPDDPELYALIQAAELDDDQLFQIYGVDTPVFGDEDPSP
jgi:hypothetical protein